MVHVMICEWDVGAVVYFIVSPTLSSLFSMTLICFWTAMCCCWLMCTLAMVQREEERERSEEEGREGGEEDWGSHNSRLYKGSG